MNLRSKGLDHVAIAVKDLDQAIAFYQRLLGLELTAVEEVPEQKVRVAIFGEGMGRVELICPTAQDTGVARFLDKRGEGLHHLCLEVEDIQSALAALKESGAKLIDESPKPGAGGAQVAFIHPAGAHGVLTELRQGPKNPSGSR